MTTYVATSHKKEKKPDTLPPAFHPAAPDEDLGMRGMRVVLMRARESVGTVTNSYEHPTLGLRAYVVLDNDCSAWVPVDDLEPYDGPSHGGEEMACTSSVSESSAEPAHPISG